MLDESKIICYYERQNENHAIYQGNTRRIKGIFKKGVVVTRQIYTMFVHILSNK